MNYKPNNVNWCVGDFVIHDADAKNERMLMLVVAVNLNGDIRTVYVNQDVSAKSYINRKEVLHDPERFGIVGYSRQS